MTSEVEAVGDAEWRLMDALYRLPSGIVLIAAIVLGVSVATAGQRLAHRFSAADAFIDNNDVAGFIIAVVGTLYAVVLGFIVVVVWQQYDATRERLAAESAAVADIWHVVVGAPPEVRSRVRRDMVAYAHAMIDEEWPAMRVAVVSRRGDGLIMDATAASGTFTPRNARESNAQAQTLDKLTILHDERARRVNGNANSAVSWFEWTVLGLGAFVVVGFCWLFGVRNQRAHQLMTASVTAIIVSMFVMIFELQFPFRGDLGIDAQPWVGFIEHVRSMDSSGGAPMRM